MIGIVLFGHGNLGLELQRTAELILGKQPLIYTLGVDPEETEDSIDARLSEAIENADRGSGVLLLTDMFGGTPMNMSCRYLEDTRVEVVTGINLAGLIRAVTGREEGLDLSKLAGEISAYGRRDISVAGELLRPGPAGKKQKK